MCVRFWLACTRENEKIAKRSLHFFGVTDKSPPRRYANQSPVTLPDHHAQVLVFCAEKSGEIGWTWKVL